MLIFLRFVCFFFFLNIIASQLESSLYKYYIVHAIQNNKGMRVHEFFTTCVDKVSKDPKWNRWFRKLQ